MAGFVLSLLVSNAQGLAEPPDLPQGVKPADAQISGKLIFRDPDKRYSVLERLHVVAVFTDRPLELFDVSFQTYHQITLSPFRSSRPPEYAFNGHWVLNSQGDMEITGTYKPADGSRNLPMHIAGGKPYHYVVPTVLLLPSPDPTSPYTLKLVIPEERK
jgi:hypothetical protein